MLSDAIPASAEYARTRPAIAREIRSSSHYVTMRDGVRIAIDVHLPVLDDGVKLPALVRQTRYFRALDPTWLARVIGDATIDPVNGRMRRFFVLRGYAWIDVDVRGSGASTGVWHSPWSPLEVADGAELLDWIIAQPWSNGRVGTTGNSYDGTAAELLASTGHPALVACAPRCSLYDVYTDVAYPGGVRQSWFTAAWTRANQSLDANRPEGMVAEALVQGYPWLDGDRRRRALAAALRLVFRRVLPVGGDHAVVERALADRAANLDVEAASRDVECRDDLRASPLGEQTVDAFSPSAYLERQRASGIPMFSISGWFDAAYQHAAIKRHLTLACARDRLLLGPWNHGCGMNVSPWAGGRAIGFDLDAELLRFFDHHLLDGDGGIAEPVRYYVMGAETWRTAATWPPPDAVGQRWFLADGRALVPTAPAGEACDRIAHDPDAGSGRRSRWRTLVSPFVVADYPDRVQRARRLTAYRSEPLAADVEIAGHPIVELFVAAAASDGAVFAYLEDEAPDGAIRYVTEGQLRLLHHAGDGEPLYRSPAPYRSFRRRDARGLVPGEIARVAFDLLPVAYRFAAGHRIRLGLATADADHFAPVPGAARELIVERSERYPSAIELPVLRSTRC